MARKKSPKNPPLLPSVVLSVIIGLLFFYVQASKSAPTPSLVSAYLQTPNNIDNTRIPPTTIEIPTLKLVLPVQASQIQSGIWQVFKNSAAWLSTSATPDEGTVIIYAHNHPHLFGRLNSLKPQDLIYLRQSNKWVIYKVDTTATISPQDTQAIVSTRNQLILYTCEGLFDQKRFVVYARPLNS